MRSGEQGGVGQAGRGSGRRLQGGLSRSWAGGGGGGGGAGEAGRGVDRTLTALGVAAVGTGRSGGHLQRLQSFKNENTR